LLRVLVASLLLALAFSTFTKANDWSSDEKLVITEVSHHPNSPRANFAFAQLLLAVQSDDLKLEAEAVAKQHMARIGEIDPNMVNGLFGLLVIELMNGRMPSEELVGSLARRLRTVPISALNVNIDHFPFLVQLQQGADSSHRMPKEQFLLLFDAALENPTLPNAARAILYHALRGYYLYVVGDWEKALHYAELAVATAPAEWELHDRKGRLLATAKQFDEAEMALTAAIAADQANLHSKEAKELAALITNARSGQPIAPKPPEKRL